VPIPGVAAVKIDVEGHEFAVLRGGRETIRRSPGVVLMVEVNAKNLDPERRAALEASLRDLYGDGLRGWAIDPRPEGLRVLADPHEAATLGGANIFVARAGSESERRLQAAARDLRLQAFEGSARSMGVADQVLRRNAADPRQGLNFHAALLGSMVREREGQIQMLAARVEDWKREATLGLGARLWRGIRRALFGTSDA
jgi:hypothetical protein